MEYFDLLDKNRNSLNKTLPRGTKLNEEEYNQGVEVWIISPSKKILITQRSSQKSHPLMWETPGGCSVAGEDTLQTAYREIKEEIGLPIEKENFKLISTQIYKQQFVDIYTVEADVNISNLNLQSDEIADAKLVTAQELEQLINDNKVVPCSTQDYNAIKDLLNL